MSTQFTTSPRGGYDLVDSHSLNLLFQIDKFRTLLIGWLLENLQAEGFSDLTAKHLAFLGQLDCGPNHAAELARRMGVSRQAVHKSVAELTTLGWLETVPHPDLGNQKVIEFTIAGERLMSRARQQFAALDRHLEKRFGTQMLEELSGLLDAPLPQ